MGRQNVCMTLQKEATLNEGDNGTEKRTSLHVCDRTSGFSIRLILERVEIFNSRFKKTGSSIKKVDQSLFPAHLAISKIQQFLFLKKISND